MEDLSKRDWHFIFYAVQERYMKLAPKGELSRSEEFRKEQTRIMNFLIDKAFPRS
jgi:hypothetical protein